MAAEYIEVSQRKYNNTVGAATLSINPQQTVKAITKYVTASATRVTTVATVVMDNHGFVVGDSIVVTGLAPFAGTYTVVSVPNFNTFTYTVANSGATSATVTVALTLVTQNFNLGMGGQPPVLQIAGTLTALQALFPSGTSAKLSVIGDGTSATMTPIASAVPTIFPIGMVSSFGAVNGTSFAATDTVRALTTVTITAEDHGLVVGQWIVVSGASTSALNGTYQVTTVADADTFTYETTTSGTVASGTATITPQTSYLWVYQEGAVDVKYYVYEAYAEIQEAFTSA